MTNPTYKAIGISLAIASGLFIGTSFVLKKTGLLKANVKYNEEAGEGYGYLRNAWWWTGMILMIVGEICNFVAYAFVDAILVTPLGALSVVVTTILSAIFLKERLSFVGKVGCFSCILGSVVIALNAPEQSSVADIYDMKRYVISPGFLSYAGVIIVACAFVALWAGPRYGKQSMFVYISVCSLIGGLSVVATQGLGSAIVAQVNGQQQFKEWFLYVLLVFVVATLVTEIVYLNKALNLFNAALVTPTYYVLFTSSTIITSAVLFQGFAASGKSIATVVLGFLQICAGVVLLQLSKSSKELPDAAVFNGDLDQIREVASVNEPESEPKADSIRGAAAIIRQLSTKRQHDEQEEVNRVARLQAVPEHEGGDGSDGKDGNEEGHGEKQQPLPRLRNRSTRTMRTPSGRQFSFTTMLHRLKPTSPIPRPTLHPEKQALKNASEEERLGLVQADAHAHAHAHAHAQSLGHHRNSSDSTLSNGCDYDYEYGYEKRSQDGGDGDGSDSDSTLGDGQALLNRLHQSLDEAQLDYQSDRQVSASTVTDAVSVRDFEQVPPLQSPRASAVSVLPQQSQSQSQTGPYDHDQDQDQDQDQSTTNSSLRSTDQLRLERSRSGWRRGNDL